LRDAVRAAKRRRLQGRRLVTAQVKTRILNEPSLKVTQINVETYKSVVQLSGFVDNATSQAKAVEIAKAVKGVTSVKNDMRLRSPRKERNEPASALV
jgi:osmotically-inducible protein OsmY